MIWQKNLGKHVFTTSSLPYTFPAGFGVGPRLRSNESPSGAFKRQRGLRQQMEGRCPDKHAPTRALRKLAGA